MDIILFDLLIHHVSIFFWFYCYFSTSVVKLAFGGIWNLEKQQERTLKIEFPKELRHISSLHVECNIHEVAHNLFFTRYL